MYLSLPGIIITEKAIFSESLLVVRDPFDSKSDNEGGRDADDGHGHDMATRVRRRKTGWNVRPWRDRASQFFCLFTSHGD
jgi:hypothetical protein